MLFGKVRILQELFLLCGAVCCNMSDEFSRTWEYDNKGIELDNWKGGVSVFPKTIPMEC